MSNVERRLGARLRADFVVTTYIDGHSIECRGIDLSTSGALVRRRSRRNAPLVQHMEVDLGYRQIRGAARTVWAEGDLQALRFVGLSDVDRLEIAEHLDASEHERLRPSYARRRFHAA